MPINGSAAVGTLWLILVVALPAVAGAASLRFGAADSRRALQVSALAALALTLVASLAVVDVVLPLPAGRSLVMSPLAQLGVQLLALAMLGLILALGQEPPQLVGWWLPVAWFCVAGLAVALQMSSLPIALLVFVGSALLWAIGLPEGEVGTGSPAVINYAALLALTAPLLLIAFQLAENRTVATPEIDRLVLALAVPGFGLVLAFFPLHAWALTMANGMPRVMFFGVLTIVQTAGFVLLLRALQAYPWITGVASTPLIIGGALSAAAGGWLALSARRDDPDDWLVYAAIANGGIVLTGLGTQSRTAGAGIALLLFVRVISLVVLAFAPRVGQRLQRLAIVAATLALAGTPGLAGFPPLWVVLRRLQALAIDSPALVSMAGGALVAGSGLLFATAVRRWHAPLLVAGDEGPEDAGAQRAMWVLLGLLVVLGLAPQIIAPAFTDALARMFFQGK